jgi:hypothetical protein
MYQKIKSNKESIDENDFQLISKIENNLHNNSEENYSILD